MNYLIYTLTVILILIEFQLGNAQICVGTQGEVTWSYWRGLGDDEYGELYADEYYPNRPDGSRIINSVQSPVNFENYFGTLTRGFISIPVTEAVLFNITGDDKVRFYLSSDESPENIQMEAYMNNYSGREEHDKYPEQNSQAITLTGGQFYYFELHHLEGGGGDHVSLWWKTSFTGLTDWNFVSSQYISNVGCEAAACPDRGSPCDDGDSTTTEDQQDGHCNCIGIPQTSNSCIGNRARVEAYYYDHIPGGDLEDLYEDPEYPSIPDRNELLDMLGINYRVHVDSFGTLVQGFLTVPVTGYYEFNITSDHDAIFFLSSNDDPALKQTHQILTTSSTGTTEHDKYIYQSTAPIMLDKDKYYFYELNHKEASWVEHYNIFWKGPFTAGDQWKRIPSIYLYGYECEIACITEGTPCDDGDPYTNDDAFDANCTCTGTPCSGPDCDDPIANYVPYPECGMTDQVDNRADASWLSCQASASPNQVHGQRHWILYDLGISHRIWSSQVWNYNVSGATNEGFQNVSIDYSEDGTNWSVLGSYNWPLASGDSDYPGFMGPDFAGVRARYVLVTSLDDISSCRGISKITFSTQECGEEGTLCDDGNPGTVGDHFDADCNCIGRLATLNDCSQDTLMLGDSTLSLARYTAIKFLGASSNIPSTGDVQLIANEQIELMPGFEGATGAILTVQIDDCTQIQKLRSPIVINNLRTQLMEHPLVVIPIEDTQEQVIGFFIDQPGKVYLDIKDQQGKTVVILMEHKVDDSGYYTKRIRTNKLLNATYQVHLTTGSHHYREAMTVLLE